MENKIKELTLLLLHLTSWKETDDFDEMPRSWKGYQFGVLEQTDKDLIRGNKRTKSVYLTEAGVKEAEALAGKYLTENEKRC